eukprot:XP_028338070.1 fibroblast growth factor 13 isoform X4 [Physeter catodon]
MDGRWLDGLTAVMFWTLVPAVSWVSRLFTWSLRIACLGFLTTWVSRCLPSSVVVGFPQKESGTAKSPKVWPGTGTASLQPHSFDPSAPFSRRVRLSQLGQLAGGEESPTPGLRFHRSVQALANSGVPKVQRRRRQRQRWGKAASARSHTEGSSRSRLAALSTLPSPARSARTSVSWPNLVKQAGIYEWKGDQTQRGERCF